MGLAQRFWGSRRAAPVQGVGSSPDPTPKSSLTIGDQALKGASREALAGPAPPAWRGQAAWSSHMLSMSWAGWGHPAEGDPHQSWTRHRWESNAAGQRPGHWEAHLLMGKLRPRCVGSRHPTWGASYPTPSGGAQPCCPFK